MKLDEIEPVAYFIDYTHQEKPVFLQKEIVHDLRNKSEDGGIVKSLHTAEQMQEYAKECVRDALSMLDYSVSPIFREVERVVMQKIFEEDTKND